jgi:exodeoxyribonuclease VII small subunit
MTTSDSEPTANQPPSFEEALALLQKTVADLEEGSLSLDESLHRFESGIALLAHCHEILNRAEQRIEVLSGFDAAGRHATTPLDSCSAGTTPNASRKAASRRSSQSMFTDSE